MRCIREPVWERGELEVADLVEGPEWEITMAEVKEAIGKIKNKAAGGSGVSIEIVKAGGETATLWMWEVGNEVWKSETIPEE